MSHEPAGAEAARPPPAPPLDLVKTILRAAVLSGFILSGLWLWGFRGSEQRAARTPRPDTTTISIAVKPEVGERELMLRQGDGRIMRVVTSDKEADWFVTQTLKYLEERRQRTKTKATRDLDALFDQVFADREQALVAYADWFFAWGRSWSILYEGVKGGVDEAVSLKLAGDGVATAAQKRIEQYFLTHYTQFLLKPAERDAKLVYGVKRILADAHADYRYTIEGLEERVREFVATRTRHVEVLKTDDAAQIRFDWDSQRWRAPLDGATDNARQVWTSAGIVVGSTLILGPVLEATILPLLGEMVGNVMVSLRLGTRSRGSGWSRLVGTVAAFGAGILADWGVSKVRDGFQREQFVAQNRAAIEATITEWKGKIGAPLTAAIDVWFEDSAAAASKWSR